MFYESGFKLKDIGLNRCQMEKVVNSILNRLVKYNDITQEEKATYGFGFECLILKIIHIISYIFIAVIMKQLLELLIMLSVLIPLRKRAGGYHAKTRLGCYMVSCITVYASLLLQKLVDNDKVYFSCWIICSAVICLLAPVDNENKRINQLEKIYYKKATRTITFFIGIIIILSWLIGIEIIMQMLIIGMVVLTISLLTEKIRDISKERKVV